MACQFWYFFCCFDAYVFYICLFKNQRLKGKLPRWLGMILSLDFDDLWRFWWFMWVLSKVHDILCICYYICIIYYIYVYLYICIYTYIYIYLIFIYYASRMYIDEYVIIKVMFSTISRGIVIVVFHVLTWTYHSVDTSQAFFVHSLRLSFISKSLWCSTDRLLYAKQQLQNKSTVSMVALFHTCNTKPENSHFQGE